LEPSGGNDFDDGGPLFLVVLPGTNSGKLKPGVASDTEGIEITDESLAEEKEWLSLDVMYRRSKHMAR